MSCSVVTLMKIEFCSHVVAWKWQWHYPETGLAQTLRGQPWQPSVRSASHFQLQVLDKTKAGSWGFRGTTVGELRGLQTNSTALCGQMSNGRLEWNVSREERRRERGEAVLSLQLHVKLGSSWIIDAINYLISTHRNDYFLLISHERCPSKLQCKAFFSSLG